MPKEMDNKILIGNKPPEDYLVIAAKLLNKYNEVYLIARGRNIYKAAEVLERLKQELFGLKYEIETGTETLEGADGKPRYVSFIKIRVYRERGEVFESRLSRQAPLRRRGREVQEGAP